MELFNTAEIIKEDQVVLWIGRIAIGIIATIFTTFAGLIGKKVYSSLNKWIDDVSALPKQFNEILKKLSELIHKFDKHEVEDETWRESVNKKLQLFEEDIALKEDWWGRKFDKINAEVKTNKNITDAQHASIKGKVSAITTKVESYSGKVDSIIIHHNFHHKEDKI